MGDTKKDKERDYFEDYENDYPIGIILNEPLQDRVKANKLENQLSKNHAASSVIGGIAGLGTLGLMSYLTAKAIDPDAQNKYLSHGIPTILGASAGWGIGSFATPILTRYLDYKKIAKEKDIKTNIFNYASLDEGGQIARLLKKDKEKIKQYQKINTQLKASEMAAGSLGAAAAFTGLAAAGYPVAGAIVKYPAYNAIGGHYKNKMYNNLLNKSYEK